jgi:hypothetical protein
MTFMRLTFVLFVLLSLSLLFLELIGLRLYQILPALSDHPRAYMILMALPFWVITAAVCIALGWNKHAEQKYVFERAGRTRFFFSLLAVTMTMICCAVWNLSAIGRTVNASGGEPEFFQSARQQAAAFSPIDAESPTPALSGAEYIHRPNLPALMISFNRSSATAHRLPLLIILLISTGIAFWGGALLLNTHLGLLFALLISGSPLLHAYTIDAYPAIGTLPLLLLSGYGLYWAVTQKAKAAPIVCGLSAALLPFVQLQLLPISCLLGLGCLLAIRRKDKHLTGAAILGSGLAIVPGAIVWVLYKEAGQVLPHALGHIAQQDFATFFIALFINIPFGLFLLLPFAFLGQSTRTRLAVSVLLLCLLVTLTISAAAVPGDLAWSRNYVFLFPWFLVLGIIGMRQVLSTKKKAFHPLMIVLLISGAGQLILGSFEIRQNRFYHEKDRWVDYPSLMQSLREAAAEQAETVYLNQHTVPYAARYRIPEELPLVALDPTSDFPSFIAQLPEDATFVLYEYRMERNHLRPESRAETIPRPKTAALGEYEILAEVVDPLSDGTGGVLALGLKNRTALTVVPEPSEPIHAAESVPEP